MKKTNDDNQTGEDFISSIKTSIAGENAKGPLDRLIAKILLYGIPIIILIAGLSYIIVQKDMNQNLISKNADTESRIEKLNYDAVFLFFLVLISY